MDMALPMGLNAMDKGAANFDQLWDPSKRKYKKMRGQGPRDDPDVRDPRPAEEKGLVLRRRRDVGSDEEVIETVRHRGQVLPRRPGRPGYGPRKASSMEGMRNRGLAAGSGGAAAGAMVPYRNRGGDDDDSEGSVPPRSRVRAKSTSGRSRASGRRRNRSSSSSSDTSSLGSSTDEQKQIGKMQRKKWITAALASVATIHAASKVYSSIESHDQRIMDVQAGKLSPEEAHKKARNSRWQDAAAIGIAALGLKGAVSEWNEVSEEHSQHKEMMEKKEEHHKKRIEYQRRQRARDQGGYYKGRDGSWYYDGPLPQSSQSERRRGGNRPDDRKMLEDSNRRGRMIDYEDGGSRDSYDYDEYRRDNERGEKSRNRARSRARSTVGRRSETY